MRRFSRESFAFGSVFVAALLLVIPLVFFAPSLRVYASSAPPSDEWPMYLQNPQRTGYSSFTAPNTNETKWFYNTTKEIDSSPAVANGRVIVGVSDGTVLAVNATTGEKLWSYDTGAGSNSIWSSPAIDSGRVYIGTRDSNLYCLNEVTGTLLWKYYTGSQIDSSPLVSNGKVFIGSHDGKLYCLNSNDGSFIWNFTATADIFGNIGIRSSPSILGDVVFVGSIYDSRLYAINASTGAKIWNYSINGNIGSSPTVYDGRIFFNADFGGVYCLNATIGTLIWKTSGANSFAYSSVAVANGRVFVGDSIGKFYCFNASTGLSIWNFTNIAAVWSSPAVADGKVFFGTENGRVYSLNEATGAQIWSYRALERVASSPAISNGTVFVGCGNTFLGVGGLFAFGEKFSLPTNLSLSIDSQTALLGFRVNLTGTLRGNGLPIAGASIVLSYSVTGGQTWNDITAVPTNANGDYWAVWQPSATGTYLVKATWTQYYPYEKGEAFRMLSVNTFDGQTVFSVTSNSTVSALAFNSSSRELSFTVTGEMGTSGFVDVTIAKSLVTNIADLRVYLDVGSINYVATSTADSWLLHFTYTHSTHGVVVDLEVTVIPEFPAWIILPIALILQFAVAIRKITYTKAFHKSNKQMWQGNSLFSL